MHVVSSMSSENLRARIMTPSLSQCTRDTLQDTYKGKDCIVGNEFHKDSFVNSITERDFTRNRSFGTNKARTEVFNVKVLVLFRGSFRSTTDIAIRKFRKVLGSIGTTKNYHGRLFRRKVGSSKERFKDENGNDTQDGSNESRNGVCHDSLPSNATSTTDTHHVHDGNDNVDKDQGQDDAFESANEEDSEETNPLDRLFLGVVVCSQKLKPCDD